MEWTLEEFKCLEKRLSELDMGYRIKKVGEKDYLITKDCGDITEIIAMYNSVNEEFKTLKDTLFVISETI